MRWLYAAGVAGLVGSLGCGSHATGRGASQPSIAISEATAGAKGASEGLSRSQAPFAVEPQLVAGDAFVCGLRASGRVVCWGANGQGQLGVNPAETGALSRPVELPLERVVQLAAGASHACALHDDGEVRCWGANTRGQLGLGGRDRLPPGPVVVPGLAGVKRLADPPLCAITGDDEVLCWGDALGLQGARPDEPAPPTLVAGLPSVRELSVGETHACAISRDAEVHCWGANGQGQSRPAAPGAQPRPAEVVPASKVALPGQFEQVIARAGGTCALDTQGQVFCWGALPGGGNERVAAPGLVRGLTEVARLTSDDDMACALRREGTVACWGDLLQGGPWSWALGRISPAGDAPTDVPGVGNVQQLATGHRFSCALRRDGSVVCWGVNEAAVAGAGVADPPVVAPRVIAGLSLR